MPLYVFSPETYRFDVMQASTAEAFRGLSVHSHTSRSSSSDEDRDIILDSVEGQPPFTLDDPVPAAAGGRNPFARRAVRSQRRPTVSDFTLH